MSSTYSLDLDALTIFRTDRHGERHDLNAEGEPCADYSDLLRMALDYELTICEEDGREGLTVAEALEVMDEDASLIYVR